MLIRSGSDGDGSVCHVYLAVVDGKQHRAASTDGVSSGIVHYAKFPIIRYVGGNIKIAWRLEQIELSVPGDENIVLFFNA